MSWIGAILGDPSTDPIEAVDFVLATEFGMNTAPAAPSPSAIASGASRGATSGGALTPDQAQAKANATAAGVAVKDSAGVYHLPETTIDVVKTGDSGAAVALGVAALAGAALVFGGKPKRGRRRRR
jgi:hypothetical protein